MSDDRIPDINTPSGAGRNKGLMLGMKNTTRTLLRRIGFVLIVCVVGLATAVLLLQNLPGILSFSDETPSANSSDMHYQAGAQSTAAEPSLSDFIAKQNQAEALRKQDDAKLAQEQVRAEPPAPVVVAPAPVVVTHTQPEAPPEPTPQELARSRKLSGNIGIEQKRTTSIPELPGVGFNTQLDTPAYADGVASLRPRGGQDFLLKHGSVIPCALHTQIISEQSGFVTCQVTQDVYSANGAALLIERGSKVTGSQHVALEHGQARVFTAWSTIDTPLGVSIKIDSLGTGPLGAAGIDAYVDNHFSERFGGAIMLSFVDDALATASARLSQSDSDITFDNSSGNASDMASKALDASINMPPTGYAHIGQRINIMVVRNIDMANVYQFE